MISKHRTTASILGILLLAIGATTNAGMTDLGSLGGETIIAEDMNDSGEICGTAELPNGTRRAFRYSGGVLTDLGTLGGSSSRAHAINASGQIVGESATASGEVHPFLYSGGVMIDLGGGSYATAADINDAGQVVGNDGAGYGYLYSGGTMMPLMPPDSPHGSSAVAINNAGEIIGVAYGSGTLYESRAYLYSGGVFHDIPPISRAVSRAVAINEAGVVLAYEGDDPDVPRNVFVHAGGTSTVIPSPYKPVMVPRTINVNGDVAGIMRVAGEFPRAVGSPFLWSGGIVTDLGFLGDQPVPEYTVAPRDMNDAGQVVGVTRSTAFIASAGRMSSLQPDGYPFSRATTINSSGVVALTAYNNDAGSPDHLFIRTPECGDGIVDPGEQCDDRNTSNGDCCTSACLYPGPQPSCLTSQKSRLAIRNKVRDSADRLTWRWTNGPAIEESSLGDPSAGTTYTLCISDSTGGIDRLVSTLTISPGEKWTASPRGWSYSDDLEIDSGVGSVRLVSGLEGETLASVSAKGVRVPLPLPSSTSEFFDQDGHVTVQLFSDASPTCWSSEFTTAKRNTVSSFLADTP